MKLVVAGASGFIGTALVATLSGEGHEVQRLVRRAPRTGELRWDPAADRLDPAALCGADAVVVLSGENIAARRWSAARRRALRDSRIGTLSLVARSLAGLEERPPVLLAASAIGLYGDRGDERLTEESAPGQGFLPALVRDWEACAAPAREAGVRVVHLRFGVALAAGGGLLGRTLPLFRLGLGGVLGSGRQYLSWVSLDDAIRVMRFALQRTSLAGPLNCVAPHPVTNEEFTRTLGRVLGRPTWLPVPAPALRLALGDLAEEAILASTRVEPRRLLDAGFAFRHPELEPALREALGR